MKYLCRNLFIFFCLIKTSIGYSIEQEREYTDEELLAAFSLTLKELFTVEVETASKKTQRADEVSASLFVITAKDIYEAGFTSINEALTLIPGINIARNWRVDSITVRGVAEANDRVLFLVDGQAMTIKGDNLTVFNQLAPIDIHEVNKVEVILGPGSALYGSGAFLAIVNVITKEPTSGSRLSLNSSTAGPNNLSVTFGHKKDDLALSLTASAHHSNGDKLDFTFPNGRPPEYIETSGIADGFNRVEDKKFSTKLSYKDLSLRYHFSEGKISWPTSDYFTDFNNSQNYNAFDSQFLQIKYPFKISENLNSAVRVYYNDTDHTWHGAYDGVVLETPSGDESWHYGSRYYGVDYQVFYEPSDDLSIVSGVEFTDNPDLFSVDFKTSYRNSSVYGLIDYQLSEKWIANIGARFEKYSFRDNTEFIPKAALLYKPTDDAVFKMMYGKAFLAASAWELQVAELVGNQNLKPELFDSFELVYEQVFNYWSSTLSIFSSKITDKREILDTGFADTSYVYNSTKDKKSQGFDWSGTFLVAKTTSLNLGISYVSTQEIDELTGQEQSMFGASDRLGYFKLRTDLGGGVLKLHAKYVKAPDSHPQLNSSTKVDLIYSYLELYGVNLNLKIANLFDSNVTSYTPVSTFDVVTDIPDNGRHLAIGIEAYF